MIKRNVLILIISTLVGILFIKAQTDSVETIILNAKSLMVQGLNRADSSAFKQAKEMLLTLIKNERLSALVNYYLGYIDYSMAIIFQSLDENRADLYLDSALDRLELAIEKDKNFAEAYALISSCYGMKIALSPIRGIIYGPKSGRMISKAKELSPDNPRVALIDAIGIYNTPSLFGGGKEKGLKKMKEAEELFKKWKNDDPLQPEWGKEEVYAWMGIAFTKQKEYIQARRMFEKALEINPDYGWVKYKLLPELMKKVKSDEN